MRCTRCHGTGFLNVHQLPCEMIDRDVEAIERWIARNEDHDVCVCDCCGDGETWHGEPGKHYGSDDPRGPDGPYAHNGGLCECH